MAHGHRFHLVVGDIKGGGAQLTLQLHDLGAGAGAQLGIEVAEGFIHQEHLRLARDRPAQGHPLLLSAGELLRQPLQQRIQFQHGGHRADPRLDALLSGGGDAQGAGPGTAQAMERIGQLLPRGAVLAAAQAEAQIARHAQMGVEGVALKHHGHVALRGPQGAHGAIAHKDLPSARHIQAR